MKRTVLLLSFLIMVLISSELNAQDLFYPEIESILTIEQKAQLDKAVKLLQKASGNENNAKAIDRKYAKFAHRNNKTDWEKKTWEAKQQRILAEKNYQSAYRMIFDLYSEIITNASYASTDDETKALSLNDDAYTKFEEADAKLSKFNNLAKEQLKQKEYKGIRTDLAKVHDLEVNGIRNQISALEIFVNKGVAIQQDDEDNIAWEQALKENTISSYHNYLDNHPKGKQMYKANNKIRELESKGANENEVVYTNNNDNQYDNKNNDIENTNNKSNGKQVFNNTDYKNLKGLIFKVQIAASKTDLSEWFIKAKAPNVKKIETLYLNNWNKYLVGEFSTYREAAKYRDKLWSTAPDAFIVVFKDGNQIQVTNDMKQ